MRCHSPALLISQPSEFADAFALAALRLRGGAGQSAEGDAAALLAFRAGGDADGDLASWDAATSPCDAGWDSGDAGWAGVMCCD